MENETYMKRLKDRLQIEFKKQDRSGVYGYTQRSVAYNSNRIEGSTLTEKQTASMFETSRQHCHKKFQKRFISY